MRLSARIKRSRLRRKCGQAQPALYFVDLLRRREVRMIRDDPVEMILRRDAQHVRLRAMHAVTKQFCLARVQQQGGVRVRLDRAVKITRPPQMSRRRINLRVQMSSSCGSQTKYTPSATKSSGMARMNLPASMSCTCGRTHNAVASHVAQLGHEVAVGKDIRLRQTLADIGQNAQSAPVTRHGQNHGPPHPPAPPKSPRSALLPGRRARPRPAACRSRSPARRDSR